MSPLCRHKVDIWLVENWIPLMDCDHLQTQYVSNIYIYTKQLDYIIIPNGSNIIQ